MATTRALLVQTGSGRPKHLINAHTSLGAHGIHRLATNLTQSAGAHFRGNTQ